MFPTTPKKEQLVHPLLARTGAFQSDCWNRVDCFTHMCTLRQDLVIISYSYPIECTWKVVKNT